MAGRGRNRATSAITSILVCWAFPCAAQEEASGRDLAVHGAVETYFEWNTLRPGNGENHRRAFDHWHDTLAVQNAVLDAKLVDGPTHLSLGLQTGPIPGPPGESVGPSPPLLAEEREQRFLREAALGLVWSEAGLLMEAGLFDWPMGLESSVVHENWCWTRSNLYLAMPSRLAGARATYPVRSRWRLTAGVFNGWTGLSERNDEKTIAAGVDYDVAGAVEAGARYVGGVELEAGAPEGRAWRHAIDGHVVGQATESIGLGVEVNGGAEPGSYGTSWWVAAAVQVRVRLVEAVSVAGRIDGIRQIAKRRGGETAPTILFAGPGVVSGTISAWLHGWKGAALVVEARRDQGATAQYFRGEVLGTGSADSPFEPNSMWQQTVLAGATVWF